MNQVTLRNKTRKAIQEKYFKTYFKDLKFAKIYIN